MDGRDPDDEFLFFTPEYDREDLPSLDELKEHKPIFQTEGAVRLAEGHPDPCPDTLTPADPSRAPFSDAGRLSMFFSEVGQNAHGSAHVIGPDIILTAGHCVIYRGKRNRNLYFVPRFDPGMAEPGILKVDRVGTFRAYAENGVNAQDVAMLKLAGGDLGAGTRLAKTAETDRDLTLIGYPYACGGGLLMYSCSARRADWSRMEGMYCPEKSDMSIGASGGGWIAGDPDRPRVVGLTSQRYLGIDYSPIFGDGVLRLHEAMIAAR